MYCINNEWFWQILNNSLNLKKKKEEKKSQILGKNRVPCLPVSNPYFKESNISIFEK